MLGFDIPLFRRFAIPRRRLAIVLLNAQALSVHPAEIHFGPGIALFRGQPIPFDGFFKIFLDTLTILILDAQINLGSGVPCSAKGRKRRTSSI